MQTGRVDRCPSFLTQARFATFISLLALALASCAGAPVAKPALARKPVDPAQIEKILGQMTLDEKLDLLGGTGFGSRAIARLGVPAIEMIDGPQGIRGPRATAFPSTMALMATWNPELMKADAEAIGEEVRAIGRNMILGPCVTLARVPQSGRTFECGSEDPLLNAVFAKAYVEGVHEAGALVSTKHYLLNNQELNRNTIDMHIDERALHELELPPFEAAIEAGADSIMASYDVIDGAHATESKPYLETLLKNQLQFKNIVLSDWSGTHSVLPPAENGLDLEMPFGEHLGQPLKPYVQSGKLPVALIDDKVRRILRIALLSHAAKRSTAKRSTAKRSTAKRPPD